MKLTPQRRAFLEAALANDGTVYRSSISLSGTQYWGAGLNFATRLRESSGAALLIAKLIEPVRKKDSQTTERLGMGYRYRLTPFGRAALGCDH